MKWAIVPILVIGILLLSACGIPALTPSEESSSHVAILLEFGELAADNEEAQWENELGRWKPATAVIDGEEKALTSKYFKKNTYVTTDNQGTILFVFEWDEEGSKLSEAITGRLIGKPLGIFEGDEVLRGEDGRPIAPTVTAKITGKGQITGLSLKEATTLSKLLNANLP